MRVKCFYISLLLFAISMVWSACDTDSNVDDPNEKAFVKYYGADGDQSGVDMISLDDGTTFLLGNTRTSASKRIFLVRVDQLGTLVWQRTFGGLADVAVDLDRTQDGSLVILARTEHAIDDHDFKILIISTDGIKQDSTIQGYVGKKEHPHSITPLTDRGFIVTGSTQFDEDPTFNPADPDAYANIFHWRCDENFDFNDPSWRKLYGDELEYDAAVKSFEGPSAFYVFGYSTRPHFNNLDGNFNLQYYQIALNGDVSNNVGYVGDYNQNTVLASVIQDPPEMGGGYFQLGTRTNSSGSVTMHVTKLRSTLTLTSEDEVLDEEIDLNIQRPIEAVAATAVYRTVPRGYLLLAEELRNLGTKNISLTKIDDRGTILWSVSLGSEEENDEAGAVTELPDGRILVLGTVEVGDNQTKMALFKLNSNGRLHE